MSCCPNDLLELAHNLGAQNNCSEAQLRCATSRGYYAALHTVNSTVPLVPGVERQRNEGSHVFIIRRAQKYGDGANPGRLVAKQIVLAMRKLKDERNEADYILDQDYDLRKKNDALARVDAVLKYCEQLNKAIESQSEKTGT